MSSAILTATFDAALVACALGLAWRALRWLRTDVGPDAPSGKPPARIAATARAVASTLLGSRAMHALGALALDALLLRRLFRHDRLRALAHHLVVIGFTWLLLVHALAPVVASRVFPGYQPTLEPWLFLRDLFGAIALAGLLLLAIARRRVVSAKRSAADRTFVGLLVLVLASGFALEAQKMASPAAFERMTDQYAAGADADRRALLRAWWAREFGVPSGDAQVELDAPSAAQAKTLHEEACASCHAQPSSAFVSWPLSRALAPLAHPLDATGAGAWLFYLHVLACVAGVASLPFTPFFHAVASPFALLLDAVAPGGSSHERAPSAAFRAVRRAAALDACVRCGICDTTCSVAPISRWLGNDALLPSRKLQIVGDIARGWRSSFDRAVQPVRGDMLRASEGAFLCTDCARCTRVCPVGLDLADLWQAQRRELAAAGIGRPDQWIDARTPIAWGEALRAQLVDAQPSSVPLASGQATFARCIQCQACSNVCPVVAHGAGGHIDLTPQRVMNLLRLGRDDLALGSRMVRACAACYQCQEVCPEGIPVADILLGLRATAFRALADVRKGEAPS